MRFRFDLIHGNKQSSELTKIELQQAFTRVVKLVQNEEFSNILRALKSKEPIESFITSLDPFIDAEGILHVGGRIRHSLLEYSAGHIILFPKNHFVTKIIVREEHVKQFHAVSQVALNALKQQFWILKACSVIKYSIHKCVVCIPVQPV